MELFSGSADGLDLSDDPKTIDQDTDGVPGNGESGDEFGSSVALADTDGAGHADLAVGVPREDVDRVEDAGGTVSIPGSADGPDTAKATGHNQNQSGVPGSAEKDDKFGAVVDYRPLTGDSQRLVAAALGENDEEGRVYALGSNKVSWFGPADANIDLEGARFGR